LICIKLKIWRRIWESSFDYDNTYRVFGDEKK
jgi:hypothetical protein